jgi:SAM-dependent methyltransferase
VTSYDEVAYPSVPLAQTQPGGFVTQAHLHGVRAPDPTGCRVLEIGCSDAGNLAWLAAHTPGSQFLGVDLSQEAVGRAQGVIAGLPNIEVRQADLTTLDAGRFDIVIAHGVYSWLPRPGDLLACIDRHLADDGIAYVSYNVMPGSMVRQMAGDVIRRHTAGMPDRVAAARALMDLVRSATVASPHAEMMREAMRLSSEKPDHLLIHDEMAEFNYAPYVDEFVADAASHQLAYLGETHQADSDPPGVTLPEDAPDDEVARQQLLDYIRNRAFRQTLLVRPGNTPTDYRIDPARLEGLHAAAPVQHVATVSGRTTYKMLDGIELTTDGADLGADLELLGRSWPGSVPVAQLKADRRVLLQVYGSRGLELGVQPAAARMPGDRPLVGEYTRTRARIDGRLASLRHAILSLDDPLSRRAVSLMDGTMTRASIVHELTNLPGAPRDVPRALDELLDELGRASLFLA